VISIWFLLLLPLAIKAVRHIVRVRRIDRYVDDHGGESRVPGQAKPLDPTRPVRAGG
jgi:hypothetical protein